jgi:hypothetical protein
VRDSVGHLGHYFAHTRWANVLFFVQQISTIECKFFSKRFFTKSNIFNKVKFEVCFLKVHTYIHVFLVYRAHLCASSIPSHSIELNFVELNFVELNFVELNFIKLSFVDWFSSTAFSFDKVPVPEIRIDPNVCLWNAFRPKCLPTKR